MYVNVILDGKRHHNIEIKTAQNREKIELEIEKLLPSLQNKLRYDLFEELVLNIDENGFIKRSVLKNLGIASDFDEKKITLSIDIPSDIRGKMVHHFGRPPKVDPYIFKNIILPNKLSAHINYNARQQYKHSKATTDNKLKRMPLSANFDGALNYHSLVLEGRGFYSENAFDKSLWRDDCRLVYEKPQEALRYYAGDLRFPIVGYQSSLELMGLGISKDFALQPHRTSYPISEVEFFLENPADVEVWINSIYTKTIRLDRGPQDIRDFTLSKGKNDVILVITDDAGKKETLFFAFIYNTSLLAKGLSQYSYNIGFQTTLDAKKYKYEYDDPRLSIYYRKGLSDILTMGSYLQARKTQSIMGLEGGCGLPYGKLNFDVAISALKQYGAGFATKCSFDYIPNPNLENPSQWQNRIEYTNNKFARITDSEPVNNAAWRLSSDFSAPKYFQTDMQISGNYTFSRNGYNNGFLITTLFKKKWKEDLSAILSVDFSRNTEGISLTETTISLNWRPHIKSSQISFDRTSNQGGNLRARYNLDIASASRAYISAWLGDLRNEYEFDLEYEGRRGQLSIENKYTNPYDEISEEGKRWETNLDIEGAICYTGGKFALARNISNGFIIAHGVENLKSEDLVINPSLKSNNYAQSDFFGPAVLTGLPPYRMLDVTVMPNKPPIGYTPKNNHFIILPNYKSGYSFEIGEPPTVILTGTLLDYEDNIINYQEVKVIPADENKEILYFFTNHKGHFQLLDVSPGKYNIKINEYHDYELNIPKDSEGIVRLNNLNLIPQKPLALGIEPIKKL